MKRRKLLGISLTLGGVIAAALGGVWLAVQPATIADKPSLVTDALPIFLLAFGLMTVGGYLIVSSGSNQSFAEPEMELPLLLLDYLRQHGEVPISQAADALDVSTDAVILSLEELQRLHLFSGYIRSDAERVRVMPVPMLELMHQCAVCGHAFVPKRQHPTSCPQCHTVYYLPKI
ncbi:hypothetical protein VZO05_05005 [Aggregatilineales bacterium SYSU G02658]